MNTQKMIVILSAIIITATTLTTLQVFSIGGAPGVIISFVAGIGVGTIFNKYYK